MSLWQTLLRNVHPTQKIIENAKMTKEGAGERASGSSFRVQHSGFMFQIYITDLGAGVTSGFQVRVDGRKDETNTRARELSLRV